MATYIQPIPLFQPSTETKSCEAVIESAADVSSSSSSNQICEKPKKRVGGGYLKVISGPMFDSSCGLSQRLFHAAKLTVSAALLYRLSDLDMMKDARHHAMKMIHCDKSDSDSSDSENEFEKIYHQASNRLVKKFRGRPGRNGKNGKDGKDGLSIKGDKGDPGVSIKGDKGDAGTNGTNGTNATLGSIFNYAFMSSAAQVITNINTGSVLHEYIGEGVVVDLPNVSGSFQIMPITGNIIEMTVAYNVDIILSSGATNSVKFTLYKVTTASNYNFAFNVPMGSITLSAATSAFGKKGVLPINQPIAAGDVFFVRVENSLTDGPINIGVHAQATIKYQ